MYTVSKIKTACGYVLSQHIAWLHHCLCPTHLWWTLCSIYLCPLYLYKPFPVLKAASLPCLSGRHLLLIFLSLFLPSGKRFVLGSVDREKAVIITCTMKYDVEVFGCYRTDNSWWKSFWCTLVCVRIRKPGTIYFTYFRVGKSVEVSFHCIYWLSGL